MKVKLVSLPSTWPVLNRYLGLSIAQVYYNYGCHLHHLGEIQSAHETLEKGLNNAIDIENYELIQKFGKELSSVSKKMKNSKSSVAIDRAAEYLKLAVDKTKTDVSTNHWNYITWCPEYWSTLPLYGWSIPPNPLLNRPWTFNRSILTLIREDIIDPVVLLD